VRVTAHCRRCQQACRCLVPATAIGKGLVTNVFIAMLFTERYEVGAARTL
jgi:transposase